MSDLSPERTIRFLRNGELAGVVDFCDENLNVLAHAQSIELDIGSRCGGHGICGGDVVRIPEHSRSAFSEVTEDEKKLLSDVQISQGFRLACQVFPECGKSDGAVEFFLEVK